MKKSVVDLLLILAVAIFILLTVQYARAENDTGGILTDAQRRDLQVEIDIFGVCLMEEVPTLVEFGFCSETCALLAKEKCQNEYNNVRKTMQSMVKEEAIVVSWMNSLFYDVIKRIKETRDYNARERYELYKRGLE